MCHRCATLAFEVDLALNRTVSPNETHNGYWQMFHGWMLQIVIEKEESEPMFKDTKAFSGFSVNDLQQAKEFYSQTLGLDVSESNGLLHSISLAGRPS